MATTNNATFFIVKHENGGIWDLIRLLVVRGDKVSSAKFLEYSWAEDGDGGGGEEVCDVHRWVIFVSILVRKILQVFKKPMEWSGYLLEFFINLISLNGNFLGLLYNILQGKLVIPQRGSETFISSIGHIDGRINLLYNTEILTKEIADFVDKNVQLGMGHRALMDLCMMSSKLAYENENVVKDVVNHHWKMHFVGFYNCWNDYEKESSTQVFILCDKPKDANLILISFRGTEPFDADDWITDFDYSWYEIPNLGKVHMGFLEALGLGNRGNVSTFHEQIFVKSVDSVEVDVTAYYTVRSKLKSLLKEHENAKFVVTGHSLGGALAILFPTMLVIHEETDVMKRLSCVYTYGQPRIGDRKLGRFMEEHLEHPVPKYFRVVYSNDLVPRLPYDDKTFLYKHFGTCMYYNSLYIEKEVREEPNKNFFGLRFVIPVYVNACWEFIRSFVMCYVYGPEYKESWESILFRMVGLFLPGISAHSPVNYVNSVRLGREKSVEMSSF